MRFRDDLTGKRFNKWTVTGRLDELFPDGAVQWVCRCECGTERVFTATVVKSSYSCGCVKRPIPKDITGHRFGKLTVVSKAEKNWNCICDCGNKCVRQRSKLAAGRVKSCGCLPTGGKLHGETRTRLFFVWQGRVDYWRKLQASGASTAELKRNELCESWHQFGNFIKDVSATYVPGNYLIRIDKQKGWHPDNFKWADQCEFFASRDRARFIEWQGRHVPLVEVAEELGCTPRKLSNRIKTGWPLDQLGQPSWVTLNDLRKRGLAKNPPKP